MGPAGVGNHVSCTYGSVVSALSKKKIEEKKREKEEKNMPEIVEGSSLTFQAHLL